MANDSSCGIADCRQALRALPNNLDAMQNLALAYSHEGRFSRAMVMIRRALRLKPGRRDLTQTMSKLRRKAWWHRIGRKLWLSSR